MEGEKYTERIVSAAKECGIKHGDTTRAFALGFDYALTHGDWHDAQKEKPREHESVLMVDRWSSVAVGWYDAPEWHSTDGVIYTELENVMYWQYLPQLPKLN